MRRFFCLSYTTLILSLIASGCVDEETRKQEQKLADQVKKTEQQFRMCESEVRKKVNIWKSPVLAETPYRRGKILLMDEEIISGLPKELLAESADECETLIVLRKDKRLVGSYTGGSQAFKWQYDVRLIDCTENAVVGEKTFQGGSPPKSISQFAHEGVGSTPNKDVVNWIMAIRQGPTEGEVLETEQQRILRKDKAPTARDFRLAVESLHELLDLSKNTDFFKSCLQVNATGHRTPAGEPELLVATLEVLARKNFGGADVCNDVACLVKHQSNIVREMAIKTIVESKRDDPVLLESLREVVLNDKKLEIRSLALRAAYARFPDQADSMQESLLTDVVMILDETNRAWLLRKGRQKKESRNEKIKSQNETKKLKTLTHAALDIILSAPNEFTKSEEFLSVVYGEWLRTWEGDPKFAEINRWFVGQGYEVGKIDGLFGRIYQKRILGWNPSDWELRYTVNWPIDKNSEQVIVEAISPQGKFIVVTHRGKRLLLSCSAPSFRLQLKDPPITNPYRDFVFGFSDDVSMVYPTPLRNYQNDSDADAVVTAVEITTGKMFDKTVSPRTSYLRFSSTDSDGLTISIWEHPDFENHRKLRFNEEFSETAARLSSTGNLILLGDDKGRLLFVDTLNRQIAHKIQLENHKPIHSIATSSNDKWIAVATEDGIELFGRTDADHQSSDVIPQIPPSIVSLTPENPNENGGVEVHVQSHFNEPWHVIEYRLDQAAEWNRATVPQPYDLVKMKVPIHNLIRGHHVLEMKTTDTAGRSSKVARREFDVSYWSANREVNADDLSSLAEHQVAISPDCKVAIAITPMELTLSSLETGEPITEIPLGKVGEPTEPPLIHPDGRGFYTFGANQMTAINLPTGRIRFIEMKKKHSRPGQKPKNLPKPLLKDPASLVILGDKFITRVSQGTQLAVIPVKSDMSPNLRRRTLQQLRGTMYRVTKLVAWPESTVVIGCRQQGGIVFWDIEHAMQLELALPDVIRNEQISQVFSCTSSKLAVVEGEKTIHVFDISRDAMKVLLDYRCRIDLSEKPGQSDFCESSGLLAILPVGGGKEITLWNTKTGLIDSILSSDSVFRKIRFSPDGRNAVTFESNSASAKFRTWEIKKD